MYRMFWMLGKDTGAVCHKGRLSKDGRAFGKNVMDRSISYILPFFEMRNGEMHHKSRYTNTLKIKAVFYGEDITEEEKETARELVKANAINLNGTVQEVVFVENKEMLKGLVC